MKAWILKFFGPLGEYLAALFNSAIQQEMKIVLPIATRLVKQVASDPSLLSGGAKRDAAIAGILAELSGAQIQVASSVIGLAVELAYTKTKVDQAALPAPTTEVK